MEDIKEQEEAPTQEPLSAGSGLSAEEVISRMEKATEALNNANKKLEENTAKFEQARVKAVLAGSAEAGVPKQKLDETPAEYAERVMSGRV